MSLAEIKKNEKVHKLIRSEIEIMKKLDNPHIAKFIDTHESLNNIYIVMEYCDGGTFTNYLYKRGGRSKKSILKNSLIK